MTQKLPTCEELSPIKKGGDHVKIAQTAVRIRRRLPRQSQLQVAIDACGHNMRDLESPFTEHSKQARNHSPHSSRHFAQSASAPWELSGGARASVPQPCCKWNLVGNGRKLHQQPHAEMHKHNNHDETNNRPIAWVAMHTLKSKRC